MLNSSLIALTTHFAQVQLRLRQIVDAPAEEKENLLKELEEFAFRGIPECRIPTDSDDRVSSSSSSKDHAMDLLNEDLEPKMELQRTRQRELINQLKTQLEDLEKYAYETGGAELPPQSVILERQNLIISTFINNYLIWPCYILNFLIVFLGHLKEKLNFNVDELCKLPLEDLRWQVDYAISQVSINNCFFLFLIKSFT